MVPNLKLRISYFTSILRNALEKFESMDVPECNKKCLLAWVWVGCLVVEPCSQNAELVSFIDASVLVSICCDMAKEHDQCILISWY